MKKREEAAGDPKRDRAHRIESQLPVTLNGKQGHTKDISASGVLFEIDDAPTVGSIVKFDIELDTPGGKLKIICCAEVSRLEEIDGRYRIGAKILNQEITSSTHTQ